MSIYIYFPRKKSLISSGGDIFVSLWRHSAFACSSITRVLNSWDFRRANLIDAGYTHPYKYLLREMLRLSTKRKKIREEFLSFSFFFRVYSCQISRRNIYDVDITTNKITLAGTSWWMISQRKHRRLSINYRFAILVAAYLLDDANFPSSAKTIQPIITLMDRSNLYKRYNYIYHGINNCLREEKEASSYLSLVSFSLTSYSCNIFDISKILLSFPVY